MECSLCTYVVNSRSTCQPNFQQTISSTNFPWTSCYRQILLVPVTESHRDSIQLLFSGTLLDDHSLREDINQTFTNWFVENRNSADDRDAAYQNGSVCTVEIQPTWLVGSNIFIFISKGKIGTIFVNKC